MSLRTRGVAALWLVLAATALAGCSSDLPDLSDADADACARLTAELPARIAGEDVSDDTDRTTSWSGIELSCGVEVPAAYDDFSDCTVIGDVGWFLPPTELDDPDAPLVATAMTHSPRVSVVVPPEHRGTDEVLATIGPAIAGTLTERKPCL